MADAAEVTCVLPSKGYDKEVRPSRIFPFLMGTCGAIAGWAISLMHWLSVKVPSTSEWTYWLIIFSLAVLSAGLPLYRSPKRLATLVACTAAAMLLAMFLGPTSSATRDSRVQQLLARPFLAFRPTSYVVGAVIGAALGLWLQEIRRFVNRINRLGAAPKREG